MSYENSFILTENLAFLETERMIKNRNMAGIFQTSLDFVVKKSLKHSFTIQISSFVEQPLFHDQSKRNQ